MRIETTKALQARRREATARVDRLIATADQRSPNEVARQARIGTPVRAGRRPAGILTSRTVRWWRRRHGSA